MAPTVPEFYAGKSIFISGGTGFIGRVLIYKLLKSCPEVKTIYLLMRQKRGQNQEERLKELFSSRAFDGLRQVRPDYASKLRLIPGDITKDGLGICEDDRKMLQNECNIVFHSAASVRFDLKLKEAVNLNTKGTLRMLTLAESMKNLEVFVHLSTAYCRCDLPVLEERLYRAVHNPRDIIRLVDWMDDDLLHHIESKVISSEPNTYSYTKAITEDLVAEYEDKFPVAIARPSIVIASWKEPVPGWVDNIQGATGLVLGAGKGVIRTMHCEPSYAADALAVDVIVNACILIAHATALQKCRKTQVYNLTLSRLQHVTWGDVISVGESIIHNYPFTVALWYPGGGIKSYWITHQICALFYHIIPAYVIDALLILFRRKPFMVRIQKRITTGLSVIQYYTTKEWHFINTNFRSLRERLSDRDNEEFYTDASKADMADYFKNYVCGIREFVCKEDPSTLPRARKLHRIRYIVDRIFKCIFYGLLGWFIYSYYHVFTHSVEYLDLGLKKMLPRAISI